MKTAIRLEGPRQPPADGKPARKLVVLLHGYGADGDDLIGLAPYLARALPQAAFVSPHAPEAIPGQPMGRQWWAIRDFSPRERLAGARRAAPILDRFLDEELARHRLTARDLALVGFSQGTMMALHVGLRRAEPCAGIVGLSGALVAPELLADELRCRPPILLVHGDSDELLPVAALFDALAGLGKAQVPALWHISPDTAHSIAPDGLELAIEFLARAFAGGPQGGS
jgi:phospholipase/carboxylesterase